MTRRGLIGLLLLGFAFALLVATAAAAPPPPAPTIDPATAPTDPTNQTSATFNFTDTDNGVTFECWLDPPAPPAPQPPPTDCSTGTVTYDNLAEGPHTFTVVAQHGGATSAPATYTWTVDTTPPDATITAAPPSTSASSVTFAFGNGEAGVTYSCSLDRVASPCTSPQAYEKLADGAHEFQVQARDPAGNVATSAVYRWTVDTTGPVLSFATAPALRTSDTSATFTFAAEPHASFLCSLDSPVLAACTSPTSYSALADGTHTFRGRAVDANGNAGPLVVYTWIVDTTPPNPVRGLRALVAYRRVTLSWQLPSDADLDHLTLFERAPRTLASTAAYTGRGTRFARTNIDNSRTYRYSLVTYDSVGNASGAATVTIPPSALLIAPRVGARLTRPPELVWSPAPGAAFYNVQLFHNGKKILSTWPRSTRLHLSAGWNYGGHRQTLRKGWYDWYVWPAFGRGRSMHYGHELGHSSFARR